MSELTQRFHAVTDRIARATAAAGRATVPQLLAVSKKQPLDKIQAMCALGQRRFGESYVQEALAKIDQLSELPISWHFIGPVQSNKTKHLAAHFDWVESVDRLKILQRLSDQRPEDQQPLNVLLQLKVGDEMSKSGADEAAVMHMAELASQLPNICLRGLMVIPPPSQDLTEQRTFFAQARGVYQRLQQWPAVDTLSMGMSGDLEAAIMEGSTEVRIGTDLFGPRAG
jgi:pyridoxal phosphate enzyme (YggS family)